MKKKKSKNSMDRLIKETKAEKKARPIYYFFYGIGWRICHYIDALPLRIKSFFQRGLRGWAVSDVWGLHYYLATVISKSMRNLKKQSHSHPPNLTEGKWIDIINEIIYTFEVAERISDSELYLINDKKLREEWQKSLNEINKNYESHNRCMTDKEIKQYEKGWRLFKEYFFDLWD